MKLAQSGAAIVLAMAIIWPACTLAAELSPKILQAFDRYVQLTEARMDRAVNDSGAFLWIDGLPPRRRTSLYAKLLQGEVVTATLKTEDAGKPVNVPDTLFLHSIGVIFLPGATLERTVALFQDYDHHAEVYGPGVKRSKLLQRDGDDFIVDRQFFQKKIVTFVFNSEFRVHYARLSPTRVDCRSVATRGAQVLDAGRPTERERPVRPDRLWRFRTYSRLEERDGGTFIEYETLFVSPELPILIRWFANPIVRSFPADAARGLLEATRRVLADPSTVGNRASLARPQLSERAARTTRSAANSDSKMSGLDQGSGFPSATLR